MTDTKPRTPTKLLGAVLMGFLILGASFAPITDDALEGVGLEQATTQAASASEFNNAFCWAIGSVVGPFSAAVAVACSRPSWGADAICADKVTYTTRNSAYGGRQAKVEGKYYLIGRSTCLTGDWQFKGGVYGSGWTYIRGRR